MINRCQRSPWRDIAVLTDDVALCPYYQRESQNVRDKGMCCNRSIFEQEGRCEQQQFYVRRINNQDVIVPGANTERSCIADSEVAGIWSERGRWNTWAPLCERSPFSRDNHLGNSVPLAAEDSLTAVSEAPYFTWEIPHDVISSLNRDEATCVLRLRYNISTTDFERSSFDPWGELGKPMLDSTLNGADAPVQNDPTSDFIGLNARQDSINGQTVGTDYPLRLNINTNQYGRVR